MALKTEIIIFFMEFLVVWSECFHPNIDTYGPEENNKISLKNLRFLFKKFMGRNFESIPLDVINTGRHGEKTILRKHKMTTQLNLQTF